MKSAVVFADIYNVNIGDRVIFKIIADDLFGRGFRRVVKVSGENRGGDGIEYISFRRVFSLVREIIESDLIVIGGGGIFQDDTGRLNLWYFFLASLVSKIFMKEVEIR